MRTEKDFKEFIALLNEHKVRYLIVGGFAYSFYAEPRFTKDIDFFVEASTDNADKMLNVLEKFEFKNGSDNNGNRDQCETPCCGRILPPLTSGAHRSLPGAFSLFRQVPLRV